MSAFPSNHLSTEFFDLITGATPYLALFVNNPNPDASGTELTGGSYARQSITFASPSGGQIKNNAPVVFNGMPSSTCTYWAIFDAATSGNLLAYGPIPTPIISLPGDNAIFDDNDIVIGFAGS